MVQLMRTGELHKGKMVKREVDDVLEEDHSSLNKRSKQSSFLHVCSFSVSVLPWPFIDFLHFFFLISRFSVGFYKWVCSKLGLVSRGDVPCLF